MSLPTARVQPGVAGPKTPLAGRMRPSQSRPEEDGGDVTHMD